MEQKSLSIGQRIEQLLETSFSGRVSDLSKSVSITEEALALSRQKNDAYYIAKCLSQLSLYFMVIGDTKKTTIYAQEALTYFETLKDEMGIANAKYSLAGVYYKTNNYQLGIVYFLEALKIYQKFDDHFNQSRAYKSLGTIYEFIGDIKNAELSYDKAIQAGKKIKDLNLVSNAYNNLSGILLKKNKPKEALALIQKSIEIKQKNNDIRGLGFAIYGRGKVFLYNNDFDASGEDFATAQKIHTDAGDKMGLSMVHIKMGELYLKKKEYNSGITSCREALEISTALNIVMIRVKAYHLLYRIYKTQGNVHEALVNFEKFHAEKEGVINTQVLKVIESYDSVIKMNTLEKEAQLQKEKQEILEKKNKDEKENLRLKQEFLSIMSHEIRTPLNAITTIVPMLSSKEYLEDESMLSSLQFASHNLIKIVNNILDFTKLDSKKSKLEPTAVTLLPLCENILGIYRNVAEEKKLKYHFEVEGIQKSDSYWIDETKFSQILGNLLSNAIKFTETGKVQLQVRIQKKGKVFDAVEFKVSDSGEGISKENIDKIFKSFSQISPLLTRKQGGTGLGLAIVKKILELHKTKIKVESTPNEGSCFSFVLKLRKAIIVSEPISNDFTELQNRKALIVDDTSINAILMKKLLSKWGVESFHANNGVQAVMFAKQEKFDFILMDIHMPEMNGYEATEIIRKEENCNQRTPIFALTADVLTNKGKDKNKLFNGYLYKPFEVEKLYQTLVSEMQKADVV